MKKSKLQQYLVYCIFVFSSCVTQKKCEQKFPSKETDSVETVISFVHDTLYKDHPEQLFSFDGPTEIIGNILSDYHHEETKGRQTAILDIHNGKITVSCKEDAYKDTIITLRKQITTTEKKTTIAPPVITYINHWYHKPLIWYFGITLLLAIGFAAGKWFKIF